MDKVMKVRWNGYDNHVIRNYEVSGDEKSIMNLYYILRGEIKLLSCPILVEIEHETVETIKVKQSNKAEKAIEQLKEFRKGMEDLQNLSGLLISDLPK